MTGTSDRLAAVVRAARAMADSTSVGAASRDDVLRAVCGAALQVVTADGAGVMLAEDRGLRYVDARPAWIPDLEVLQECHRRGPCWRSATTHEVVVVEDLAGAVQWPELAAFAQGRGRLSLASVPMLAQGRAWGVLDLYREDAGTWSALDLELAGLCATTGAALLVLAAERDGWHDAWVEVEHRSTHDELTGLPGRGLLFDRLDHAIDACTRRGTAVAVLFVDIDGFKAVNDQYGHQVGDAALVAVAHRLGMTLRSTDMLARLSGDEFVIVCEDLSGPMPQIHDWLHRLGERILLELRRPAADGETAIAVTVSIGAAITTRACTAQSLTAQADHAMYAAKHSGGGRLVLGRPGGRS